MMRNDVAVLYCHINLQGILPYQLARHILMLGKMEALNELSILELAPGMLRLICDQDFMTRCSKAA